MSRFLAAFTVFLAVVTSGVVHGVWTNRWAAPEALGRATARMADLPMTLADWDGQPGELDASQLAVADVSGHLLRRYVNRRTGAVVTVLLLCGRPGPISVHRPEVCYGEAGYELTGPLAKYSAPAEGGELWVCRFQKFRSGVPEYLRILYGWNATGQWEASENPRSAFARSPALYKVYVIREMPRENESLEEDPSVEFLHALVPALRQSLFPAPAGA